MTRGTDTFLDRIIPERDEGTPPATSHPSRPAPRRGRHLITLLTNLASATTPADARTHLQYCLENPVAAAYARGLTADRPDGSPDHQLRLAAAERILDRIIGKPTQTQIVEGDIGITTITALAQSATILLNNMKTPEQQAMDAVLTPPEPGMLPPIITQHVRVPYNGEAPSRGTDDA